MEESTDSMSRERTSAAIAAGRLVATVLTGGHANAWMEDTPPTDAGPAYHRVACSAYTGGWKQILYAAGFIGAIMDDDPACGYDDVFDELTLADVVPDGESTCLGCVQQAIGDAMSTVRLLTTHRGLFVWVVETLLTDGRVTDEQMRARLTSHPQVFASADADA